MTFLLMLYLLGELGTYYAFAGIFSYRFGGYQTIRYLTYPAVLYPCSMVAADAMKKI